MGDAGRVAGGGLKNAPTFSGPNEETSTVNEADKIQRDGVEIKQPKISEPDSNPQISKNPQTDRENRVSELYLRGQLMQAQFKAAPAPGNQLSSKAIIAGHTGSDGKIDTAGLAEDLAKIGQTPGSEYLIGSVLEKVPVAQRPDVARELVNKLGDAGMKKIALTSDGRMQLNGVAEILRNVPKADWKQINNIYDIVRNGPVEEAVLNAVAHPDFRFLKNHDAVINDIRKFGQTSGYKKLGEVEREQALKLITTMSIYSAQNPKNTTARNTLDQFVNGKIRMEFSTNKSDAVAEALVYPPNDRVVKFNIADQTRINNKIDLLTDTAHEVNHLVNPLTPPASRERFLTEYRAFYMQGFAVGENPPKVDRLIETVKFLAASGPRGDGYDVLRNLYLKDHDFADVIDGMLKDLNAKPPKIPTPEEVRLKFLALNPGNKSPALNQKSNMDNH